MQLISLIRAADGRRRRLALVCLACAVSTALVTGALASKAATAKDAAQRQAKLALAMSQAVCRVTPPPSDQALAAMLTGFKRPVQSTTP